MAEIKIEKKATVWPWIIAALLIVGALLYFFVLKNDDGNDRMEGAAADPQRTEETRADQPAATSPTIGDNGAVDQYVQFVTERRSMDLDHEYTNGALLHLTAAVRAKAQQLDYDAQTDLDQVEEHARQIQQDPLETAHANKIRSAADILANALAGMQQQHFPDLGEQATEVQQAASGIDPNTLTLDQRDAVKGFFDKSATLIQNMR